MRVEADKELGLRLRYWKTNPTTNTEQINVTGGVGVSVARKFTGRAVLTQNGLTGDLTTGDVNPDGLTVSVGDITYQAVAPKEVTIAWKRNGSTFDLPGSGTLYVGPPSSPAMKVKATSTSSAASCGRSRPPRTPAARGSARSPAAASTAA